ncbi:MAG: D-alanine--D-alanine ligase [Bacteroidales bacterium]|nr:D-alanine--D-alanine ligase [Candidatus Scybalousia scybalohippi]
MKKTVALVAGGYSGEYVISIQSAAQVEDNLKEDFNLYKIIIDKNDWYYEHNGEKISVNKDDFSLTIGGKKITFDAAFIIVHGTPGENGLLQGYFDMIGIPYNTCDALCSAVTFDKETCNAVVRDFNVVNVAKNHTVYAEEEIDIEKILEKLSLPVFVKPSQGGSSIGMSKVKTKEKLLPAIKTALDVHPKVLIEEFIEGREFSCGIFTVDGKASAFPVTEIIPINEFFDYEAKYNGTTSEVVPANIPDSVRDRIQRATEKIYRALNCKGVCRIDFIYDEKRDMLFFLEVNTTPGQSLNSIVPNQVRAMGKDVHWLYYTQMAEILK